jgi:hypothetical protein
MADLIKWTTLTAAIAAQTISVVDALGNSVNLTIYSEANVPVRVPQENCPALFPQPDGFVSNVQITRDAFGADAAPKSIQYVLTYNFAFAPVGQGNNAFEKYGAMVTAAAAVLLYFATHTALSGSTDFLPQGLPKFGPVSDGTGTLFHGCKMAFNVMQYLEA